MPESEFDYNLHRLLATQNSPNLRNTALLYCQRSVTFRGLFAQTERCAKALCRWGVRPEMEIPIPWAATPEVFYLILALWKLGAVPRLGKRCPAAFAPPIAFAHADQCPAPDEVPPSTPTVLLSPTLSMPLLARRRYTERGKSNPSLRHILWKDFLSSGDSIPKAPQAVAPPQQKALRCCPPNSPAQSATASDLFALLQLRCETSCKTWQRKDTFSHLSTVETPSNLVDALLLPLCLGLCLHLEPFPTDHLFTEILLGNRLRHLIAPADLWRSCTQQKEGQLYDFSCLQSALICGKDSPLSPEEEAAIQGTLAAGQSPAVLTTLHGL